MKLPQEFADQISALTEAIDRESDPARRGELIFRRGRLRWKVQDRAGAMSDYAAAAELAPGCGASEALAQCREIMAFYHRDLYNP
ncbi:MAG: hypothetical protein K2L96_05375 [Muribaculaceae bacterium]|nr:hypothetical protein [Muribaculaceae bacterium]